MIEDVENHKRVIRVLHEAAKGANALFRAEDDEKKRSKELAMGFVGIGVPALRALYGVPDYLGVLDGIFHRIIGASWNFDMSDHELFEAKKRAFDRILNGASA